jgi:hypothetical protein
MKNNIMQLQPNYIVDNNNNKIAAQIDIKTYNQINETLENYALMQFIDENIDDDNLSLADAKSYYKTLK